MSDPHKKHALPVTWPGEFTEEMQEKAGVIKAIEIHCALVLKYQLLSVLKQPETDKRVWFGLINVVTQECSPTMSRVPVILNIQKHKIKWFHQNTVVLQGMGIAGSAAS